MDKITIKNLKIFAFHGVNPEEKENGQNFFLDIDYYLNMQRACQSDCLDDTVSYAKVVKTVRRAFTGESYDLIERAAQAVADAIFDEFESIYKLEITLKKPEAPVNADFEYMAVTIIRER
jgi:dihydroneopterin aldolase